MSDFLDPETLEALDFMIYCDAKCASMTEDGFVAENRFIRVERVNGKQVWKGKPFNSPIMYMENGKLEPQ